MDIIIRNAMFPNDINGIKNIDTAFTTYSKYEIVHYEDMFSIKIKDIESKTKVFIIDNFHEDKKNWDISKIAIYNDFICGFIAAKIEEWNKRLIIWHIYVDKKYRNKGIGKKLMSSISEYAKEKNFKIIWLEVSNYNVPAIMLYHKMGFKLCGLDLTLYLNTESKDEVALYMSKLIE
jgi:ribosomal protein S18 acetylase RimI-like enzyme